MAGKQWKKKADKQELLEKIQWFASRDPQRTVSESDTRTNAEALQDAQNVLLRFFPNANAEAEQAVWEGNRLCLLREIQKYASWGADGELKMQDTMDELLAMDPNAKKEANQRIMNGRFLKKRYNKAYSAGRNNQPEMLEKLKAETLQYLGNNSAFVDLEKNYNRGLAARIRTRGEKLPIKGSSKNPSKSNEPSQPAVTVNVPQAAPFDESMDEADQNVRNFKMNLHPNALKNLKPSSSWTILVDETGKVFKSSLLTDAKDYEKGKCVAVLVPEETKLEDLSKGWHAVDQTSEAEIVKHVQHLLNSQCGILGIPAESLPASTCDELWFSCIEGLMDMILRLLPISGDGKQTILNLRVEQRGDFRKEESKLLRKTCDDAMFHLSRVFPERAKQIKIDARIIAKDSHVWNGYADVVAFTWGSPAQKQLLKQTGWLDTCLLGTEPFILQNTLDVLGRMQVLEPEEWNTLVLDGAAENPNSMVAALLDLAGNEAKKNPDLWTEYLEYVQQHLYSKAIHLRNLGKQTKWLAQYMPEDCQMTPRLRLIWLTTVLAESNHHGRIDVLPEIRKEFEKLCTRLYPEDAPLVCQASLHVTVAFIDEFLFKAAKRVLDMYWKDVDEAIPGRRFYCQICSTYGQLAAFAGQNDEAIAWFEKALKGFLQLTDTDLGQKEWTQTQAYQLISMMDSDSVTTVTLNRKMETYLKKPLTEAVDFLAVNDEPKHKYAHHVLLRYLLQRGSDKLRERYLAQKPNWKHGEGHPWELIEFYRALLIGDAEERQSLLRRASEMTRSSGATLDLISCVILGGLYFEDDSCREELAQLTENVIATLPELGTKRIRALRSQLDKPVSALELAKTVLPFNFR